MGFLVVGLVFVLFCFSVGCSRASASDALKTPNPLLALGAYKTSVGQSQ